MVYTCPLCTEKFEKLDNENRGNGNCPSCKEPLVKNTGKQGGHRFVFYTPKDITKSKVPVDDAILPVDLDGKLISEPGDQPAVYFQGIDPQSKKEIYLVRFTNVVHMYWINCPKPNCWKPLVQNNMVHSVASHQHLCRYCKSKVIIEFNNMPIRTRT